jgi:hypothetical protein
MRGITKLSSLAVLAFMTTLVFSMPMSAGDTDKDWTVLLYNDGDNNLESYALTSLSQLEMIGSDDNVNLVALTDTLSDVAYLQYVEKNNLVNIPGYGYPKEADMSSGTTLEEFIEIGVSEFPADHYAVILWDHGGGWRGICWDDTTLELTGVDDFISMAELRSAFWGASNATGEPIDVVGFDACLMAMPEVAYQMRGLADYLVFSEETISAYSFPYDTIAAHLEAAHEVDAQGFAAMICEDYAQFYASLTGFVDWTISAFHTENMAALTDAVEYFGSELLGSLSLYINAYQRDQIQADRYYYPYNVDLMGFANNILADSSIKDEGVKDAARQVAMAVDACVESVFNGMHNVDSTGLAIYFPSTHGGMHDMKEEYAEIPFAIDTGWYVFCEAFSDFNGRTWVAEKLSY